MTSPARILGAILGGGTSSRFGSDKALALHEGRPLIGHVAAALAAQTQALVICGRAWGGTPELADQPAPGLGPIGGICAAMQHGAENGFTHVLIAPCDLLGIPADTAARLLPGPAVAEGQWLLGLWPTGLCQALTAAILSEGAIPVRRWIQLSGAVSVAVGGLRNVNRPGDLPI